MTDRKCARCASPGTLKDYPTMRVSKPAYKLNSVMRLNKYGRPVSKLYCDKCIKELDK